MIKTTHRLTLQQAKTLCLEANSKEFEIVQEKIMNNCKRGIFYVDLPKNTAPIIIQHLMEQGFQIFDMEIVEYKWTRVTL